jgi:intracellular sulfur oxidation DsrE/DsrF family protein
MKIQQCLVVSLGLLAATLSTPHAAADGDCPRALIDRAETFGPDTSSITHCIRKHDDIKVVVALQTAEVAPNGLGRQINVVRQMVENYPAWHQMNLGEEYRLVVVAHGPGARWLLTNDAYNRQYNVTTGNPSLKLVQRLVSAGVPIYMCQSTMEVFGWKTTDIIPGVLQAPGGALAIVDFAHRGYVPFEP